MEGKGLQRGRGGGKAHRCLCAQYIYSPNANQYPPPLTLDILTDWGQIVQRHTRPSPPLPPPPSLLLFFPLLGFLLPLRSRICFVGFSSVPPCRFSHVMRPKDINRPRRATSTRASSPCACGCVCVSCDYICLLICESAFTCPYSILCDCTVYTSSSTACLHACYYVFVNVNRRSPRR